MRDLNRLEDLARGHNVLDYGKERLLPFERARRDSIATSPVNQANAKDKLALLRTSSVYWKDPTKQKRNLLRSKKEKAALLDTSGWTYTKAERFKILDQEIRNGGPPGLAQAVLAFDMRDPLDVNVAYVTDTNGDAVCTGKPTGWLELCAARGETNDVAYIRLLTNFGASQASRDMALRIALERKAMNTAQELFRNDADPNAAGTVEHFFAAIRDQNQQVYTMFLMATIPLNPLYINQALVEAVGRDSDLVGLLIAHGADGLLNDGQALRAAIALGSLPDTAMMLTNSGGNLSTTSLDEATEMVCAVEDEKAKLDFLDMLLSAGANANTSRIHDELLGSVKENKVSIAELLIFHGTSPDFNDAEVLRLAISSAQTDLVNILLQGNVPQASVAKALEEASGLEDPDIFEDIVRALLEKGVSQNSVSKCLYDSVEKGYVSLVPVLIEKGAILDYADARCVRQALKRNDFGLFGQLLEAPCRPSVLSQVLLDAMTIQPPSERFDIISRLLNKGVSGIGLHIALQTAAANAKDPTDYGLIEALLRHHASVDFFDNSGNCVCTAAAQQDERGLDLLCQGNPSPDTVSAAISFLPVSFATAEAGEYEQQVGMMSTLLEKGAYGTPVAEMLIRAARDDHRKKALTALIHHGADANYQHGKCIEEALALPRISALEMICKGCKIDSHSFATQIPNALRPQGFSLDKASLLAHASKEGGFKGVLDKPLLDEVESNDGRRGVIELLLALGASVNFQHARALQHAVVTGNLEICCLLLSAGVERPNIALAFPATSGIQDLPTRYSLMEVLLKAGQSKIGQDQALVQASQEAIHHDLSHVELLLAHQASPNFNDGAAVLWSIQTMNLPLVKRFMLTELNKKTLSNAFTHARKIECTKEERYAILETLLEKYSDQKAISMTLIEAVRRDPADIKTSTLLLDHGASIEPKHGFAMQLVASAGTMELLNLFLSKGPSQTGRDASFASVTDSPLDAEQRKLIYKSLLETGITQDLISAALLQATRANIIDHSLLALLIAFNASLDFDSGSAAYEITARGELPTLTVLLQGNVSQAQTLDRSFSASMGLKGSGRLAIAKALLEKQPGVNRETVSHHLAQIVKENDHNLLSLMMDYGPDPAYNSGKSLILAARAGDAKAAEMLARAKITSDTAGQAFEQLLNARIIQSTVDGLQTAKILLSLGVAQHLIDRALLDGFDDDVSQLTSDLVELLIPYKPNVSGGDGKVFVKTASSGNVELFRRLASQKPDLDVVIPALLRSMEKEDELIPFLELLEECAQRESTPLQDFVIFTALTEFPEGNRLAKHLLNHGCPANSKTDAELDASVGMEAMTVLIWALSRTAPTISEEVIVEILEDGHNVEVSFATSVTHTTSTIIASTASRNTVLKRLIEIGVDISHHDKDEHSALFYASRGGHVETAELLTQAGAKGDDGSLHEAAREAHPQVIELLLANGHRVDFPSAIHAEGLFGRTALEELCLNATPGTDDWQKRIRQSIGLLLPATVAEITQSGGKAMLHLALENEHSVAVTRELLAFPAVWENINHSIYLYKDTQGYVYSPTKYAELLLGADNEKKCQQLTKLLRARKCKDRFYAHTVVQPEGAVGLPEDVAEAVNKQKRADHEQREELKRRDAIAVHQRAIEAEDYERNLKLAKERHNLLMRQLKEEEHAEKQVATNKQAMAVRHAQELQRERQDALRAENKIRLEGADEEGARRRRNAASEQQAELTHQGNLLRSQNAALKSKLDNEQQIINARAAAARKEYDLQVALGEQKVQSEKDRAYYREQGYSG